MYYSTLGYANNPLIHKYRQSFIAKLRLIWSRQFDIPLPSDDFLLYPDIHSLLFAMSGESHQVNSIKDSLLKEYSLYGSHESILKKDNSSLISNTSIELTTRFYNPDYINDSHPDHIKNHTQATFGDRSVGEWQSLFAQSLDIVHQVSSGFLNEIEGMIQKIIPFDISYGVHNSGSYSTTIGHLWMSYPVMDHPELALLEAILHEYNHNKLYLILQTEVLVLNDTKEVYYSPYRPDTRHIHGIYLGLHALSGAYWTIWNAHSQGIITISERWIEKAALYVFKNGLALQILDKYGLFTPTGKVFLDEMRQVHIECLQYVKQAHISQEIMHNIKDELAKHYNAVKQLYPNLHA